MKRALAVLLLLAVVIAGGLYAWRRRVPPLPPPPTAAELAVLTASRDALEERLATAIAAKGEKSLKDAPRGGIMLGIPTGFTRSVVQQVVTGLFHDLTLTLRNLKVHKAGDVKVKMVFRKKRVGTYVLDVDIHEVSGVLRPGRPELSFRKDRIEINLPVRLEEGSGRADLRFRWDSKGLAANATCGDVDTTKTVTGGVVPADYRLEGGFEFSSRGESMTLTPRFPDLAVRIFVDPSEQAWAMVDEVIKERGKGCEIALEKVDVKSHLARILGRGFNVKIPQKIMKPIRLPAGVSRSLEVQGVRLPVKVTFTGVLMAPDRIWYGADLALGEVVKPPPSGAGRP